VRLDVTLNTCEGVLGESGQCASGSGCGGKGEEKSASNDDSIKPLQSGLREDAWMLRRN
jgi:hypothetical protein